jgi:prolyl 4-hydroxylase
MRSIILSPLTLLLLFSILVHQVLAKEEQCRVSESTGEKICDADGAGGSSCGNKHENCDFWAGKGECEANPNYMKNNCALACGVCGQKARLPTSEDREQILELVKKYGEPQEAEGGDAMATLLVIRKTISYMRNFVLRDKPTHTLSEDTIKKCINRHDRCAFWSAIGECEGNPAWMATNCAPSCQSCHLIDFGESQDE